MVGLVAFAFCFDSSKAVAATATAQQQVDTNDHKSVRSLFHLLAPCCGVSTSATAFVLQQLQQALSAASTSQVSYTYKKNSIAIPS